MLKVMIVSLLVGTGVFLSGCQTMTHDEEQQKRKYSRISDVNRRLFNEDIQTIFFLDEPSKLTQWKAHVD